MLKPYTRQIRKTDEVLSIAESITLKAILNNSNTLYNIQDMPVVTSNTKLRDITGINNLVIVVYKHATMNVFIVDSERGYFVRDTYMYGGCVGLKYYTITNYDSGYIINTNYKNMEELARIVFAINIGK